MSSNNYGGTRMEEWQRALKSHSDEEQEAQYDYKTTIRRGYSKNQVREMKFPVKDYQFPEGVGSFTGALVMKKWGKRGALICYFDTEDEKRYKICAWFNHKDVRSYRPLHSDVDVSLIEIGSVLKVEYDETASGNTRWVNVEILEGRVCE